MNKHNTLRFFWAASSICLLLVLFKVMPALAGTLSDQQAAALKRLSAERAGGAPFAVQEIEILDAFEAGLPLATIEADIVISRVLYNSYVAGKPISKKQQELLARYRTYNAEHGRDLVARNAQLNADHPEAKGTTAPDRSRDWQLYSDPRLFNQLSSAFQNRLEAKFGHKGKVRPDSRGGQAVGSPDEVEVAPPNTLVNNPAADATARDTQSETTLILGSGSTVLSAFNDSGSAIGGANKFTGIARSTNSGSAWTDQGTLPNSANGDAGDPVLSRSALTSTVVLSTLGFTSSTVLQMFRSTDNGASYLPPVDGAAGGGGDNDKEWVTCDNFPGSGQGNFYMFWRDFGGSGGMTFTRSTDDGATWGGRQDLTVNSGQGAWVVTGADHAVYCFWLATGNTIVQRKSTDRGATFSSPATVTTLRTTGVNGDLGLNGGFRTNAFPQVVANPNNASQLYAVWNDKGISPSTDRANIYFTTSTDGGATWATPLQVNTDSGIHDNYMPCIAITPDGTGLFISWYDRRLDPANSLIDVFARHATISGGTVAFGPDYRVTSAAFPVVIGQDPGTNPTYMGDYDSAVGDNTHFYRTWGDNRLPLGSHAHQPDVRFTKVPKTGPGPIISAAGSSVGAESCAPPNGAPDPGERVTFNLSVTNSGTANTTNLMATLQATGGVTNPSGPQNYGVVMAGGPSVARPFTFTASGTCGGNITATLKLQDGATNLGTVTYTFALGAPGAPLPPVTHSSGGVMVPIPAAGTQGDMLDQIISVPNVGAVTKVKVKIRLNHTFDSDLRIRIVSPTGISVTLSNHRGGSGDNFGSGANDCSGTFTVFDDGAATPISSGSPPFAGSFRPDSPLSAINGSRANGNWTLKISDDAGGDSGTLFCWQLEITQAPYVCVTPCGAINADFNGDNESDIIWQNNSTGARSIWLMNGTAMISSVSLGTVSLPWNIMGTGDFNGDGETDILWQNSSTGARTIWLMNGTSFASSVSLGTVSTPWNIAGASDFNGDGDVDILWQNSSTGARSIWLMNGTVHTGNASLGTVSTPWSIVGSGDFNGDGKADILWQNNSTGARTIWLMNGTSFASSVSLGTVSTPWNIGGTGDYNADGKLDILWQNSATGARAVWLMNGTVMTSSVSLGTVSLPWDIRNH